jgi:HPt (histidine-containing phosphotransfer) domain-containing protein
MAAGTIAAGDRAANRPVKLSENFVNGDAPGSRPAPATVSQHAPERIATAMTAPPIDLEHLDRQTFGDADLRDEILALFAPQARLLAGAIRAAGPGAAAGDLAHQLKGSALAVGAFALARAAEACEGALAPAALAALDAAVADAAGAADALLRR